MVFISAELEPYLLFSSLFDDLFSCLAPVFVIV
jgi:hypothetical protein